MSVLFALALISPSALISNNGSPTSSTDFTPYEDFENWIPKGYEKYGTLPMNKSLAIEVMVGTGEKYESIQDALDAGYSCIGLKTQQFNVTQPITPLRDGLCLVGTGAEIIASQPMPSIFDIRNIRYAHLDGIFINGNGLAQKCIDAMRSPSGVPIHQICNCKVWGATTANVDLTGCEDSLIFNCWIDGRKTNDTPTAITKYGVKIGEFCDGYRTGGQLNLIHCLIGFHKMADIYAKNIAQLKLANCLLASKNVWSNVLKAHIIMEGGTGENALMPALELANCWVENGAEGNVPNIFIMNKAISKITILGGMFYTGKSPNIYSPLNPCAQTITLISALLENHPEHNEYNIEAPTAELISLGNTYNGLGINRANVTSYMILDKNDEKIETNAQIGR